MIPALLTLAAGAAVAAKLKSGSDRKQKLESMLQEYEAIFAVPSMEDVRDAMTRAMAAGLRGEEGGLLMLPSFVDVMPTGDEEGEFFAIDLGGTNLRVLLVTLAPGRGQVGERVLREWPIPPECFDTDSGRLLDWVAERTLGVAAEVGRPAPGAPLVVGFCFSFAFQQTALDNGVLLLWTKNFRGSGLVGRDVVAALVAAFAARGAVARVPALVNDTVAALVAARYADPAARAAFILGTGTNAACLMDAARMRGLPPGYRPRGAQMVVNTEWGDLAAAELPRCEEDVWVDCASANPGRGTFEKLVAGLYLGEVARRVMLRLAGAGALFGGAGCGAPGQGLARPGAFGSAALAAVDADASPGLGATAAAVAAAFAVARPSRADLQAVQRVCRMVGRRSVRLVAAGLAAVVAAAGGASPGRPCAVAVDGSVFARYPGYQEALGRALAEVMGAEAAGAVALRLVPDGSIMGAAVLAAAVAAGEVGAQQQGRGAGEVQG